MRARHISVVAVVTVCCLAASAQDAMPPPGPKASAQKYTAAEISELQENAAAGDTAAQFALGNAYADGNGVSKNLTQAAVWYRKAAEQGNAKAQNSLGVLYCTGDGVEKDKKQAVQWYHKAAKQGNGSAMFNLGAAYYNGEGVGIDDTVALAWFLLSSEAGDSNGRDAAKRAEGEHPQWRSDDAYLAVGQMYEKGDELPHDTSRAAVWYRKAADRGNAQATLNLASLYVRGKEYESAKQWCDIAAGKHLEGGYYCLGFLFQNGLGAAKDPHEAFKWYLLGARAGQVQSMRIVAQKYEKGDGVERDVPSALAWFLIATRRGDQDSLVDAKRLAAAITRKDGKNTKMKLAQLGYTPEMADAVLHSDDKGRQ